MTLFAVLAFEDESPWQDLTAEELERAEQPYAGYATMLADSGHGRGWQVLKSAASSATVQVVDGATVVTDGPFIEAKEALGGWYVIEAADMAQAIELAALCPSAAAGRVSVHTIEYSSG